MDESETFEEWEDEDEDLHLRSLFSDDYFTSLGNLVQFEREHFDFDLLSEIDRNCHGDYEPMMLVNFIRHSTSSHCSSLDIKFISVLKESIEAGLFRSESFIKPFLPADELLLAVADYVQEAASDESDSKVDIEGADHSAGCEKTAALQGQLDMYKRFVHSIGDNDNNNEKEGEDGYYFEGYSHVHIHETMLRDEPRTKGYEAALLENSDFLQGKTVLDVGCGTGILCLFAAKAGAKKVIGVDCSSMADRARSVVAKNGYDNIISIVKGKLETCELPVGRGEVDVIVSEWMGYGLYFENMLSSVLFARDRYLAPGGMLMPSQAHLFIEGLTASGEGDRVGWWKSAYGFDLSDMSDLLTDEAQIELVDANAVITERQLVHSLDIAMADDDDLEFEVPFSLIVSADDHVDLKAFAISFDVQFDCPTASKCSILSTSIQSAPTHWKQTVLWLRPENVATLHPASQISGMLSYQRSESNSREYKVVVTCQVSHSGKETSEFQQVFFLKA